MVEEGAFSACAHARNIVERIGADGFFAFGAVRGDGIAVRFIAQALDVKQGWVARGNQKRLAAGQKDLFGNRAHGAIGVFIAVCVGAFGFCNADNGRAWARAWIVF